MLNPPYGERITAFNIKETYKKIGRTIKEKYSGCGYAIIAPTEEHIKIMSLPYDKKIKFSNGGIRVNVIFKR